MLRTELLNATAFLRRVASDRALLTALTPQEKQDLLNAAGDVFCPDPEERRVRTKALKRQRRSERIRRDDAVLAGTGIRALRDQAVFTTPNVYPPADFVQLDAEPEPSSIPSPTPGRRGRRSTSNTATSARRSTARSITSTISSASTVATSTTQSAPNWPI
jgi:hypothetical protein